MMGIKNKGLASLEMFLLIGMVFSVAFVLAEADFAGAVGEQCCSETKSGAICQEVSPSECADGAQLSPSSCDETSYCDIGCCIDDDKGIYTKNSPRSFCEGRWVDEPFCNLAEADLGCCVLGDNTEYVNKQRCSYLSALKGFDMYWDGDISEALCVAASDNLVEGACVLGSGNCEFTNQEDCVSKTGSGSNFYPEYLCTAPELETNCEKTEETTCVQGKDEVYFLDSCGNPANIYDASRYDEEDYWSFVYARGNTCNPETSNAESETCGACNRYLGSVCSSASEDGFDVEMGDYYCEDVSCTYKGEVYQNGESWCVYDGKIGDGFDVVGSRHWKYVCNYGDIQVEPCADARNEICVEETDEESDLKAASCKVNNWRACIQANSGSGECGVDCERKTFSIDSFNVNLCTPKYPEGFGFDSENRRTAKQVCGAASKTCVVKYEKRFAFGSCECVENCGCEEGGFTQGMNDICRSLGDCGGYVNVKGRATSGGYSVSNAPGINVGQYKKFANPNNFPGQAALVGNIKKYLDAAGITEANYDNIKGLGGLELSQIYNRLAGAAGGGKAALEADAEDSGGGVMTGAVVGGVMTGAAVGGVPSTLTNVLNGGEGLLSETATPLEILPDLGIRSPSTEMGPITGVTESSSGSPSGSTSGGDGGGNLGGSGIGNPAVVQVAGLIGGVVGGIVGGLLGNVLAEKLGLDSTGGLLMSLGTGLIGTVLGGGAFSGIASVLTGGSFAAGFGSSFMTSIPLISLPMGPTFLVLGAALIIASLFFGAECPPVVVTYTCQPWQQPKGGADCDSCNDDPLKPCSEYRCNSLGAACELVNKGTGQEVCVAGGSDDGNAPIVEPWRNLLDLSNETRWADTEKGYELLGLNGECIDAYTPVLVGVNTNERSVCKYDFSEKRFEEMEFYFGDSTYKYNHTSAVMLPEPEHSKQYGGNWSGDLKMFVKCEDVWGNVMPSYYTIDTCVNEGPDNTPPLINAVFPPNDNGLISFDTETQNVTLFTNEPADCRWSFEDKDYESMENEMNCLNGPAEMNALGYECKTQVRINDSLTTFYVRCEDQPWLVGENASKRNANMESLDYILQKPENDLRIIQVSPVDRFEVDGSPASVDLRLETAGGGDYIECYYSFEGYENMIMFYETLDRYHKQPVNLGVGNYDVYYECKDETGDFVRNKTSFELYRDFESPGIARIFNSGGSLNLITTESAECVYSTEDCIYDFKNGTAMGGGERHTISVKGGETYYIKCRDGKGNEPAGCSAAVRVI